jgi:acyl-CoA synthetase (NDP forming)
MQGGLSEREVKQFERIFYARSIAVVGASTDENKMGSRWVAGLLAAGYKGAVYPVNLSGGELMKLKIYPNLTAIPGTVDLVISCIPRTRVLDLLNDCAAKQIGGISFFTAGFRETGETEWIQVEEEMARRARAGGFRIVGPNCMGITCPESGIPFGPSPLVNKVGSVAFISQSGGHAGKLGTISLTRQMGLSKLASIGNCCDLGSADYLEYLAWDPRTEVVGMYLEGPRDSARLIEVMRTATRRKPVFVWKGGRTAAGARAATSHTGALAASASVWSGALRQAGAVEVNGLDEMADTLLLYQSVGRLERANVGIICGLTDGGGGEAVLSADACAAQGIEVTPFTGRTRRELLALLGQVGSVLVNPVDVSQRTGNLSAFEKTIELVAAEPNIDIIAVYENMDILLGFIGRPITDSMNEIVAKARKKYGKPVIVVSHPGAFEKDRVDVEFKLFEAGVPVFPGMERAARAIANVRQHCRLHPQ